MFTEIQQQVINENSITIKVALSSDYRPGQYTHTFTAPLADLDWQAQPNGKHVATVQFDGFTAIITQPAHDDYADMLTEVVTHESGAPVTKLGELEYIGSMYTRLSEVPAELFTTPNADGELYDFSTDMMHKAMVVEVEGHGTHIIWQTDLVYKREAYTEYHIRGGQGESVVRHAAMLTRKVEGGVLEFHLCKIESDHGYPSPLGAEKRIGAYLETVVFHPNMLTMDTITSPDFKIK